MHLSPARGWRSWGREKYDPELRSKVSGVRTDWVLPPATATRPVASGLRFSHLQKGSAYGWNQQTPTPAPLAPCAPLPRQDSRREVASVTGGATSSADSPGAWRTASAPGGLSPKPQFPSQLNGEESEPSPAAQRKPQVRHVLLKLGIAHQSGLCFSLAVGARLAQWPLSAPHTSRCAPGSGTQLGSGRTLTPGTVTPRDSDPPSQSCPCSDWPSRPAARACACGAGAGGECLAWTESQEGAWSPLSQSRLCHRVPSSGRQREIPRMR